ncbi:Peptidyl-prolyl cis-trans isomerase CYP95 [Glycine max]|nr:Peptidyl-prolyl cis-trans isomerase CYP95 [Glycine max]
MNYVEFGKLCCKSLGVQQGSSVLLLGCGAMAKKKNPLVFMDVSIDGDPVERMVFELFYDIAPKTAENFRALCTGEKGVGPNTRKSLHYKGSFFHRIKGSFAQGLEEKAYMVPSSQSPRLKHDGPGLLSMAVADRDMLGSHFTLTFKADPHLDRKHVVFGKLVQGHDVLKKIEEVGDEEGLPSVTVKIINCGEHNEDGKKINKSKKVRDGSSKTNSHEVPHKGKHKKSRADRRRKYYSSESDSSSDLDMESSESNSDSDSDVSSSSYTSSSSDDRRRKRKRSRKNKLRRGKRRDKHRDKRQRKQDKRSKLRSRRELASHTNSDSGSRSDNNSDGKSGAAQAKDKKHKGHSQRHAEGQPSVVAEKELHHMHLEKREKPNMLEEEEFPKENGEWHSNSTGANHRSDRREGRQPDVMDDQLGKSRNQSRSPKRTMSMSISPRSDRKSPSIDPKRRLSRSPGGSRSPHAPLWRSLSRSPNRRSIKRSPVRGRKGRSVSRSPVSTHNHGSISRSPVRSRDHRSGSASSVKSLSQGRRRSLPRAPSRRSISRSPVKSHGHRILSRSPVRSRGHRSVSASPVGSLSRSHRSSPRAPSQRSISRSPVRTQNHRSVSRSPVRSCDHRIVSASPVRSLSRSCQRSSPREPSCRSISRSPVRTCSDKSVSRSPMGSHGNRNGSASPVRSLYLSHRRSSPRAPSGRSISRSPVRVSRKSISRNPVRSSARSLSRSSGRVPLRSISRSSVRAPSRVNRRSYSRSRSPVCRARTPRGRSLSRSVSPDVSPKRIRRGRGFNERYSYARRYRTPSQSPPMRSYRYSGYSGRNIQVTEGTPLGVTGAHCHAEELHRGSEVGGAGHPLYHAAHVTELDNIAEVVAWSAVVHLLIHIDLMWRGAGHRPKAGVHHDPGQNHSLHQKRAEGPHLEA